MYVALAEQTCQTDMGMQGDEDSKAIPWVLTQGLWNHWEEDGNRSNSCEELAFPSFASYDHCTDPQNEEGRDIWRLFSRRLLNLGPMHP